MGFYWSYTLFRRLFLCALVPYIHISFPFPSPSLPFLNFLLLIPTHTEEDCMKRGELVNWYLKEVEADIETIEELAEKNVLVEKVIDGQVSQHVS